MKRLRSEKPCAVILADLHPAKYGSAEEYVLELADEMWHRGVRPVVAFLCRPAGMAEQRFRQAHVEIELIPEHGWCRRYFAIAGLVRRYRPVAMHIQFYPIFSCLPLVMWLAGCRRTVFHDQMSSPKEQSPWLRQMIVTLRNRLCCLFITRILASSRFVWERLVESYGISPEKIDLLYNGVNLRRFSPERDGSALRREIGIGPRQLVVSFIGHLIFDKGVNYFLDAAAVLLAERRSARFLVVGTGKDAARFKQQARELGIDREVIFTGCRDDVENVQAATDIVVMPSQWPEAMGLVLLETMASGNPIVATRVGGISEAIEDGVTGILVPPGQSGGIVRALRRLLDDPNLRRQMGEMARRRAEQMFDIRRLASEAAEACLSNRRRNRDTHHA